MTGGLGFGHLQLQLFVDKLRLGTTDSSLCWFIYAAMHGFFWS